MPRRLVPPRWLDARLIGGVVLVLVAVLLGSVVVSSADRRQPVWSLSRDVAAGTVLTGADLRPVRVQLGAAASRYLDADVAVAGRTVHRSLRAGELLAAAELTDPEPGVTVTVPMQPENAPEISRGERITLWLSTKTCRGRGAAQRCAGAERGQGDRLGLRIDHRLAAGRPGLGRRCQAGRVVAGPGGCGASGRRAVGR